MDIHARVQAPIDYRYPTDIHDSTMHIHNVSSTDIRAGNMDIRADEADLGLHC